MTTKSFARDRKLLAPEQVRHYEEDGIVFPVPILPAGDMQRFEEEFADLERRGGGTQKYVAVPHLFFPWAWEMATLPSLLDAADDLLGPDVVIESSLLLCKYPHDPAFAPWHQDGFYSGWHKTPSVSAWFAIVPATRENGCMQVVPGSQRAGWRTHAESAYEHSLFGPTGEIQVEVDEAQAVCVTLAAGEASFHHSHIVHGSPPNRSDDKRISLIVRFVTPAFRERKSTVPVVRARGAADLSHLGPLAEPPSAPPSECFTSWQVFNEQTRRAREARSKSPA